MMKLLHHGDPPLGAKQKRYKAYMHGAILGSRDILVMRGMDVPGLTAGRIKCSCSRPTHAVPTTETAATILCTAQTTEAWHISLDSSSTRLIISEQTHSGA